MSPENLFEKYHSYSEPLFIQTTALDQNHYLLEPSDLTTTNNKNSNSNNNNNNDVNNNNGEKKEASGGVSSSTWLGKFESNKNIHLQLG